jgi:peptidoglycan LD-endopeptidase LytH
MILITFAGLCALAGVIVLINLVPSRASSRMKALALTPTPAPPKTAAPAIGGDPAASAPATAPAPATTPAAPVVPAPPTPSAADTPPPSDFPSSPVTPGLVNEADITALKVRNLLIPVTGVSAGQLRDTFYDGRSEGRTHEALDIMAAGGTPVMAADDGTVVRLFQSAKGGITLYQLDASGLYIYYYAHLRSYAEGISEGKQIRRGEVIAYVGDTGNAGAGNYHLHFAILKPIAPRKWSGGIPINPYPILVGK